MHSAPCRHFFLASVLAVLGLSFQTAQAATPQERFFAACAQGDAVEIRRAVALGANVAALDTGGQFGLVLAAKSSRFPAVQALLWAGAKASQTDVGGKTAFDQLPALPQFAGDELPPKDYELLLIGSILRAYRFLEGEAAPRRRPAHPSLVLLNEQVIDYLDPPIRDFYWVNLAEKNGMPGKDNDGNGFVGDVYGWNAVTDRPYELTARHVELIESIRQGDPFLIRLLTLYNGMTSGDADARAKYLALKHEFNNPDAQLFGPQMGNDLQYLDRVVDLAHGSHVAGIVGAASHGKAWVQGLSWGQFGGASMPIHWDETTDAMARESSSLEDFLARYTTENRREELARGHVMSRYVQASGAGVVNMSLGLVSKSVWKSALAVIQRAHDRQGLKFLSSANADAAIDRFAWDYYCDSSLPWALMFSENPNVLFVTSAGNDGLNNDALPVLPADFSLLFPNVIGVAAADAAGTLAEFSNYGATTVSLAAPGVHILSPTLGGWPLYMDGTSMAAPAVAGVVAEMRASSPSLLATQLRDILEYSARADASLKGKTLTGANLDGAQALATAAGRGDRAAASAYYRQQGRLHEAGLEVDAGLAARPSADLWGERGWIAADSDDYPGARDAFTSGLQLNASHWACLRGRSIAAFRLSDWNQCVADCDAMIASEPNISESYDRKAVALVNAGDGPRAVAAFAALVEVYKRQGKWPNSGVLLGWAVAQWLAGKSAEAQNLYRQVDAAFAAQEHLVRSGYPHKLTVLAKEIADSLSAPATATGPEPSKPLLPLPPLPPKGTLTFPTVPDFADLGAWELPTDPDNEPKQDSAAMKAWIARQWKAGYAITAVAGFPGHWRIVMSKNSGLGLQSWVNTGAGEPFPETAFNDNRQQGRALTGVAGDGDGWLVVFSAGSTLTDQHFNVVGPFPEAFISRFWATHQITGLAGWGNAWVAVMSRGTPKDTGAQVRQGPGHFSFPDWETPHWKSGQEYSTVAGGSGNPDQWVAVMSSYPSGVLQSRLGPQAFPKDDIRERWSAGKRIVAIAGYPKGWVVIMQTNTGLGDQVMW